MSALHIFQSTRHASALALLAFVASSGIVADAQQPGQPVRSLELDSPSSPMEALRASQGMIEDNDMFRLPDPPRSTADRKSATQPSAKTPSTKTSPESISAVKNRPLIEVVPEDLSQSEPPVGSLDNAQNNLSDANNLNGGAEGLLLSDVIASVYRSYPEVAASRSEFQRANGELTSAFGSFDTKLKVHSLNEPLGVFENYRHGISVARQTWWGGYVSAGYRIGRGIYAPWYLERETDKGGEFKLAYRQSLLQGLAIDPQRVAVFQAELDRRTAGPQVQLTILDTSRDAAIAYWKWVSEGTVLEAQRELLELAEMRNEQFEVGVKAGKFPEIDLILNTQLVAERQAKLLQVQQKFREAAFKLSLFLRDDAGEPMVPQDAWLPKHFPVTDLPIRDDFQSELYAAIERRPEFALLQLKRQQLSNDRSLAYNQMQPTLDFIAEASQDIGEDTSSSDNKDELLVFLGVEGELPIQRRKARGKIQSTTAKIAQLNEKVRLQSDKVAAELRTGYASLELYAQVVEQADLSLRAAFETLDRYRFAFTKGKADLIVLNLVETKAYETEIKLIESQQQWFRALAELQASLGLDPLTQAGTVDAMPASNRPGPGNPPTVQDAVNDDRKPADADDEAAPETDADAEAETPNE